jgi:colicin import membrane protein
LNESKLSYLAIALSVGAILMSGLTAGISALPNSASLAAQHEELSRHKKELNRQSGLAADSEQRLREFDIALVAIANAAKIEPSVLSKSFEDAKAASEQARAETLYQAKSVTMPNTKVDVLPVVSLATSTNVLTTHVKLVEPAVQPAATVKPAPPTQNRLVESHDYDVLKGTAEIERGAGNVSGLSEPADAPVSNKPAGGVQDNPFGIDDTASALSVAPGHVVEAAATIQQVDGILGQRISENWYKPANTPTDVSTVVQLSMARNGKVTSIKLTKASGNDAFDASAMSAMNSIGEIAEVAHLPDADYTKAYASRLIKFTPQMGK